MIAYQRENVRLVLEEALPLMRAHWEEVAYSQEPFDPDTDAYLALEAAGLLRIFTTRDGGKLQGYVGFIVSRSINHRTLSVATECGTFVRKEARRGRIALRMIDFAQAALVQEGIRAIHFAVPKEHPGLGAILARRGYNHEDSIFVRRF